MMDFEIDIDGIKIELQIRDYKSPKNDDDKYDSWCELDYSFTSGEWLNFNKKNDSMLLSFEIDDLVEGLTQLLDNKITNICEISFLEPDFEFILYPVSDLRDNPDVIYVKPGHEMIDISLEWRVFFYHQGVTANFLTVTLDRDEIKQFLDYLISVQNK